MAKLEEKHQMSGSDEISSQFPIFVRDHPILAFLAAGPLALVFLPSAAFIGLAVLALSFCAGQLLLLSAPFTLVPAVVIGAVVSAGYAAAQWAVSLVLRGTVGSENTVMMRPQASASALLRNNEAHGNLELNLVKVQHKEGGGPPDQKS